MAGAVVVQILLREAAARGGDRRRAGDIAVDQEGDVVGVRPEGFEDIFAARDHFVMVVGGDVEREQLGLAGLVLGADHGVIDQRAPSSLNGANTWLPCGSSFLMKSPPSQKS